MGYTNQGICNTNNSVTDAFLFTKSYYFIANTTSHTTFYILRPHATFQHIKGFPF